MVNTVKSYSLPINSFNGLAVKFPYFLTIFIYVDSGLVIASRAAVSGFDSKYWQKYNSIFL